LSAVDGGCLPLPISGFKPRVAAGAAGDPIRYHVAGNALLAICWRFLVFCQPLVDSRFSRSTIRRGQTTLSRPAFWSEGKAVATIQKITPFLWFDHQAEEAAAFYVTIFPDSKVLKVVRQGEVGPGPAGSPMVVDFRLAGQKFVALNGGPLFKFTEAISFVVNCQTQDEVDAYWEKLSAGGTQVQCGWLKDKFGLSWQIVPTALPELLADPDPVKAGRVMQAMMTMKKLDIGGLRQAYDSP
jgi:predicted 3-demethylubiquinone-9 3-methyltransferase (glyoxalase superfamily)